MDSDKADRSPPAQWLDPAKLQLGPVRHVLTPEQVERAHRLQALFADYDGRALDDWLDGLRRDSDPDAELATWEAIADAFTRYTSARPLAHDAKLEVFKLLLMRSIAPAREVLARVTLNLLTAKEAAEVLQGYR